MLPSRGARIAQRALYARTPSPCNAKIGSRYISTNLSTYVRNSTRWRTSQRPILQSQIRNFSLVPSFFSSPNPSEDASTRVSTPQSSPNAPEISSTSISSPSSQTSSAASEPPTLVDEPLVTSTPIDSLEFTSSIYTKTADHVGYLKELGLDHGWGPTSVMQFFYEHVHVYSGLSWGMSIVLTAALYRVFILSWPTIIASDQAARNMAMAPAMTKAMQRMQKGELDNMQYQMESMRIRKAGGISFRKMFLPIMFQAPLGYGTFTLLRQMAALPVPGLEDAGFWWIKDLTVSDPYFILPIALFASLHIVSKRGYESGGAQQNNAITPIMTWVLPAVMGGFMCWMPATLQLSFFTTSVFGVFQGRLLQVPQVRDYLGMYPIYKPNQSATGTSPGQKTIDVKKVTNRKRDSHVQSQRDMMGGYQAPAAEVGKKSSFQLPNISEKWRKAKNDLVEFSEKQQKIMGWEEKRKTAAEKAAERADRDAPDKVWRR